MSDNTPEIKKIRNKEIFNTNKHITIFSDYDNVICNSTKGWRNYMFKEYDIVIPTEAMDSWTTFTPEYTQLIFDKTGMNKGQLMADYYSKRDIYEKHPFFPTTKEYLKTVLDNSDAMFIATSSFAEHANSKEKTFLTFAKENEIPLNDKNIIHIKEKWLLANNSVDKVSILIDDNIDNVTKFVKAGGYGVLFTRPWNEHEKLPDNCVRLNHHNDIENKFKELSNIIQINEKEKEVELIKRIIELKTDAIKEYLIKEPDTINKQSLRKEFLKLDNDKSQDIK